MVQHSQEPISQAEVMLLNQRIEQLEQQLAASQIANLRLQESKDLLQLALDNIPSHVVWKDQNSVFLGCNKTFADTNGLNSTTEIIGKTDYDFSWKPEETEEFRRVDRRIMEANTAEFNILEPQFQSNGQQSWLETNKVPLHDEQGNVNGILITYQEVTARVEAELATQQLNSELEQRIEERTHNLYRTTQILQTVLDTLPQIICWKDRNSVFMGCNNSFLSASGYATQTEVVGKDDNEMPWADQIDWYQECDRRVMESGQAELHITETLTNAEGQCVWLDTSKAPLRDTDGDVFGVLIAVEDVSDRKRAEETIVQKTQELEQTLLALQSTQLQMIQNEKMATLGDLVAGVAHEINNPIGFLNGSISNAKDYIQDLFSHIDLYQQHYPNEAASIKGNAEKIELEFLIEDLPELLNSMQNATDRIKNISTSLRTFSRADSDYKVTVDLHEGINSTLQILKYRLKANDRRSVIKVIKHYGELPKINCFPGQLNQVFMNILANAIDVFDEAVQESDYSGLGEKTHQITIQTAVLPNQKNVEIRIGDNGKGISETVQTQIFDHLFTTKSVGKGTGLGLAISKEIVVEKHGGSLQVQSELGQGTQFLIQLPIA